MVIEPICIYCKHLHKGTSNCNAFPDGIPKDIMFGGNDHLELQEGDHDIQFQPDEEDQDEEFTSAYFAAKWRGQQ